MIALAPTLVSSVASAASAGIASLAGPVSNPLPPATNGPSFGQLLDQLTSGAVDTLKTAEGAAISGVQGKIAVQTVVDTIMSAERTLQTVIAVRDKAVNAYQEISKMAI